MVTNDGWLGFISVHKLPVNSFEKVYPNTHYSENKGNNGRENAIKILNISLL